MSFVDLTTPAGLKAFDDYIAAKSFIQGYMPTSLDAQAFALFGKAPPAQYTHALRYYNTLAKFTDFSSFRPGAGVPDQIAGSVKGPAVTTAPSAPAATTSAAPAAAVSGDASEIEAAIAAQGEVVRKLKADKVDKSVLQPEIDKLIALKSQLPQGEKKEAKKEEKKEEKKGKKEGKKEEKKEAKKEEKKEEKAEDGKPKYDPKFLAKVEKEGGKKGQDVVGVFEMGGLEFFCTSADTPEGDLYLTNVVLDNMNKEIDPTVEERRGGAAEVGKMIFSAGVEQLAIVARVPKDKVHKINTKEWMQHVLAAVGGELVGEASEEYAQGVVVGNKEKGRFPIKLKDDAISTAVGFLKSKGCFPDADDDDDDIVYGDDDFDI